MDDIKPNQSLDGMRGGEPLGEKPANQSFDSATSATDQYNDADFAADPGPQNEQAPQNFQQQPEHQDNEPSSNKGLKVVLTLFVILFIAATAAAVYFYQESQKEPVNVTSVNVTELQQKNDSLTYDNKTLTTQNQAYVVKTKNLTTTAQQLKTKCGSACSSITIPQ